VTTNVWTGGVWGPTNSAWGSGAIGATGVVEVGFLQLPSGTIGAGGWTSVKGPYSFNGWNYAVYAYGDLTQMVFEPATVFLTVSADIQGPPVVGQNVGGLLGADDLPLQLDPLGFFWVGFVGVLFVMIVRRGFPKLLTFFRPPHRGE
jgi:hypothetical protein